MRRNLDSNLFLTFYKNRLYLNHDKQPKIKGENMGYTRYWDTKNKINNKTWKEFTDFVKKAIELSGVIIKDGHGENEPIIDENIVLFNGDASTEDEHESFVIERNGNNEESFAFCKTARKPYDVVVAACLKKALELNIVANVSSDGENDPELVEELFRKAK